MSHYGPPSNSAAFPRGNAPAFRGPPPAFPRGIMPPFRPPFAAQTPPPPFAFRGPSPTFLGPRPPLNLNLVSMLAPTMSPATPTTVLPLGWQESRTPQGALFYYNATTGVSTYEMPTSDPETCTWREYKDEATGASYYFNTITKETVWDQPEELRMQKAREEVAKMTSETLQTMSSVNTHVQTSTPIQTIKQIEKQEEEKDEDEKQQQEAQAEAQAQARQKRKEIQEQQQAAEFTDMPRAERLAAFKQFLEEKQIAPTLKWSDALRMIGKDTSMQNDSRWKFALQTVGEKKQAYAEYCTQAKNRLTIEKRRLGKKAREEFIELLGLFETSLAPSRRRQLSWEEVNESNDFYAMRKDPRWTAIDEAREKQQLFTTFMQDLERNQKARLAKQREVLKLEFLALLQQRMEAKELDFENRSSKRLDGESKRRVLEILEEVKSADGRDKISEDVLRNIDRHDVYDWTEKFVRERREIERAKRKRERVERAERTERLERELSSQLKQMAGSGELTSGSTWDEFAAEYLKEASEQMTKDGKNEDSISDNEKDQDIDHLHWKTQRRIFDKNVRRLRRAIEPVAAVIRTCLDRNEPVLRVTEATTFAAYIDALSAGVSKATDTNAPEEGEEEMMTSKEIAKTNEVSTLDSKEIIVALETAIKTQPNNDKVVYPAFVRQVYDMWVAMAKEDSRREGDKKDKRRKRSRKESHEEEEDDQFRRSRHRSSTADEHEEDKSHKKRRSRRSSRKRRRSHASLSASRSRSKSRRSSRRTHSHSRSRDRFSGLPSDLTIKPIDDLGTETLLSPLRTPSKPLSEAEEAARAEEIIRQARLKMQVQGKDDLGDDELEEGEEVEEGET
ncbi:Spliceosomal protein FBP11/Splicing factor PRP40 [Plasmopara halstedii]|uniref:Spliceosomal protein FBP11/Splicing factor PRP40 n=1 Tax=Plasmopara halstedii TaxID=4781 RepID=A0A0P1ASA5_PLAHL|nr:Spliceosomal protein FBP11/Splicing factor PRP40 [Plasmopara halstedii]CEG44008.1 Spliceosomal protein FBP11/Splicing factor PRP40 [Plasmopara halstedii]|eukprot:XP_024580377.1 Spliceosomal protein FBP11/Splicing factor PRP40 [Plasmopara halstedii]